MPYIEYFLACGVIAICGYLFLTPEIYTFSPVVTFLLWKVLTPASYLLFFYYFFFRKSSYFYIGNILNSREGRSEYGFWRYVGARIVILLIMPILPILLLVLFLNGLGQRLGTPVTKQVTVAEAICITTTTHSRTGSSTSYNLNLTFADAADKQIFNFQLHDCSQTSTFLELKSQNTPIYITVHQSKIGTGLINIQLPTKD